MNPHAIRLLTFLMVAGSLLGQPTIGSPVNQASFLLPSMPQYGIAQGAMFAVFGSEMGPPDLVLVDAFPIPLELAGTSAQVTVGDTTVDCLVVFTSAGQLALILPSDTPAGEGTLTVTYNGLTSEPAPIKVVPSAVGLFTLRQDGQGPGVFTDADFAVNGVRSSFEPGGVAIAWVTGLGARPTDDAAAPVDLKDSLDIEVLVGGLSVPILYAGPSGCCAGVDQIAFEVPPGREGCFVPVVVRVGASYSNFASMSVASGGGTCSDPHGFSAENIDQLNEQGSLRVTAVQLSGVQRRQVNGPLVAAGAKRPSRVEQDQQDASFGFAGVNRSEYAASDQALDGAPGSVNACNFTFRPTDRTNPFAPTTPNTTGFATLDFDNPAIPDLLFSELTNPPFASSWEVSEDGLTYTFTLREDIRWSDGEPVTAQDLAFTFQTRAAPGVTESFDREQFDAHSDAFFLGGLDRHLGVAIHPDGITVLDDQTLQIQLIGNANDVQFLANCFFDVVPGQTEYEIHESVLSHFPASLDSGSTLVRIFPSTVDKRDALPFADLLFSFRDFSRFNVYVDLNGEEGQ